MKQGVSMQDLAAELQRQAASKEDYIVDTGHLYLSSNGASALTIQGIEDPRGGLVEYGVTDHCHKQIAERLSIPRKFYHRLRVGHPDLLDHTVNALFERERERRMVRTLDGDARAFLSDRYRRLDNFDLAEAILPVLGEMPDAEFHSCQLTERRMYIKVVLPRIQAEVKVGDVVQAGVVVSNSEVGSGSLSVAPMLFRLICLNGMIVPDMGTSRYHVGRKIEESEEAYRIFRDETLEADDKALFMKVTDVVKAACSEAQFGQIVASCKELADIRIEGDPVQAVERMANRFDFSDGERGSVLNHLIEGGDLSAWGALNAVTRASQDVEDYDRATDLERVGGEIAEMDRGELATLAGAK